MKKFPTLYKKTSTGKIQTWDIQVIGNTIYSESGQLNGKKIQSSDQIKEGKNIGRSNETTPEQQAILEAEARHTGKLKKGYTLDLDGAAQGILDEIIAGGYPMQLAHDYAKQGHKIIFPCAVQPKLDGIRCGAIKETLWTRTRKRISMLPHISEALRELDSLYPLDGELYNHTFKKDFEVISHIVRQEKEVATNYALVQYHIYDIASDKPFLERLMDLAVLKGVLPETSPLKIVETKIVEDEGELIDAMDYFLSQGYEGAMARNLDAPYEGRRSYNLQKLKEFEDAEFVIVGLEEGRGKLAGHCGAFICETADGTQFKAKMSGATHRLKEYWENKSIYMGKLLTVKFQGLTGKNGVPRFPVGMRLRHKDT